MTTHNDFLKRLEEEKAENRWFFLRDYLRAIIREVLIMDEDNPLDNNKGFFDLGMDSFVAAELKNRLKNDLGEDLALESTHIFDYPSINELTRFLASLLTIEILIPKEYLEEKAESESRETQFDEVSDEELLKELMEETKKGKNDER